MSSVASEPFGCLICGLRTICVCHLWPQNHLGVCHLWPQKPFGFRFFRMPLHRVRPGDLLDVKLVYFEPMNFLPASGQYGLTGTYYDALSTTLSLPPNMMHYPPHSMMHYLPTLFTTHHSLLSFLYSLSTHYLLIILRLHYATITLSSTDPFNCTHHNPLPLRTVTNGRWCTVTDARWCSAHAVSRW